MSHTHKTYSIHCSHWISLFNWTKLNTKQREKVRTIKPKTSKCSTRVSIVRSNKLIIYACGFFDTAISINRKADRQTEMNSRMSFQSMDWKTWVNWVVYSIFMMTWMLHCLLFAVPCVRDFRFYLFALLCDDIILIFNYRFALCVWVWMCFVCTLCQRCASKHSTVPLLIRKWQASANNFTTFCCMNGVFKTI